MKKVRRPGQPNIMIDGEEIYEIQVKKLMVCLRVRGRVGVCRCRVASVTLSLGYCVWHVTAAPHDPRGEREHFLGARMVHSVQARSGGVSS